MYLSVIENKMDPLLSHIYAFGLYTISHTHLYIYIYSQSGHLSAFLSAHIYIYIYIILTPAHPHLHSANRKDQKNGKENTLFYVHPDYISQLKESPRYRL